MTYQGQFLYKEMELDKMVMQVRMEKYSGSVVKTQIQSFYNELIYVVEEGEGCSPYAA